MRIRGGVVNYPKTHRFLKKLVFATPKIATMHSKMRWQDNVSPETANPSLRFRLFAFKIRAHLIHMEVVIYPGIAGNTYIVQSQNPFISVESPSTIHTTIRRCLCEFSSSICSWRNGLDETTLRRYVHFHFGSDPSIWCFFDLGESPLRANPFQIGIPDWTQTSSFRRTTTPQKWCFNFPEWVISRRNFPGKYWHQNFDPFGIFGRAHVSLARLLLIYVNIWWGVSVIHNKLYAFINISDLFIYF